MSRALRSLRYSGLCSPVRLKRRCPLGFTCLFVFFVNSVAGERLVLAAKAVISGARP